MIGLLLFAIVLLALLVLVYTAYPGRGQQVPKAAWIGAAMVQVRDRLPTLDRTTERSHHTQE